MLYNFSDLFRNIISYLGKIRENSQSNSILFIFVGRFPGSSVDKESACNAGDPGLIPGLGRSSGEGMGYPLQYSWASFGAQLVKNPPAMRKTWVWSLEKGMVQYSGLENSMDYIALGVAKSQTWLSDFHFYFLFSKLACPSALSCSQCFTLVRWLPFPYFLILTHSEPLLTPAVFQDASSILYLSACA